MSTLSAGFTPKRILLNNKFKVHVLALACSSVLYSGAVQAEKEVAPTAKEAAKPEKGQTSKNRFEKGANMPGQQIKAGQKRQGHLPNEKMTKKADGPMGSVGLAAEVEADPCNGYSQFENLTGQDLYDFVRQAEFACISELYSKNDAISVAAYQSDNVVYVANQAKTMAATYDSRNGDEMLNIIYFLRGAFYIEYYNDDLTYANKNAANALRDLLVEYSKNPLISDTSDMQGDTLAEFFIAWDSASAYLESVPVITNYLNTFSPEHLANSKHRYALTKALTTLYYGSWDAEYTKASMDHGALIEALLKVATSEYIYNSAYAFESTDSFHEFARFYEYQEYWNLPASLKTTLNAGTVQYMNSFERMSAQWADAAGYLDYYNPGECEQFGICGWEAELEAKILSINYNCSDTINIRAQQLSSDELQASCDLMGEEEILFHEILNTGSQPVADDLNTNLEVNIFDSYDDYDQYAGIIFGISTDNGGMYLEGTPSQEGNQARFIAHEATWTEDILVWNLRHEYVHYLDGRFNQYGAFNYFDIDTGKSVWWSEGLAEYISHQNRYDEAVEFARTQAFSLSDILSNTYDSGSDRVYKWGYLAVRFLFENHRSDVDALLVLARGGDASGWLAYIDDTIGQNYNSEWNSWLASVTSNDEPLSNITPPPVDTDGDGVIDSEDDFPNDPNETTDTDGDGVGDNSDVFPTDPTEWADSDGDGIGDNADTGTTPPVEDCGAATITSGNLIADRVECVSGTARNSYYTYVDADNTPLYISTSGGSGDVNLYFNQNTWADASNYTAKSDNEGNEELISVIANRGWVYISLVAVSEYQGVSISVSETQPTNGGGDPVTPDPVIEDACATEDPYSYGGLNADDAICIADGNSSYYFYIPNDATEVTVKSGNGTGDVNLYGDGRTWASASSYQVKSENNGNSETLTISNPSSGWYYISAEGAPSSTGASLVVSVKN